MKYMTLFFVFCLGCFLSLGAELSEKELERMERSVKMGSIRDSTIRNDEDEKIEVLKFYTYQNEDDEFDFRMRVTVELTEKAGDSHFAQIEKKRGKVHVDYTGEDQWEFHIPQGDLVRPKLTAYVIQYGIFLDGEFVVLAEDLDDAESADEIEARCPTRLKYISALHTHTYRDSDGSTHSR